MQSKKHILLLEALLIGAILITLGKMVDDNSSDTPIPTTIEMAPKA